MPGVPQPGGMPQPGGLNVTGTPPPGGPDLTEWTIWWEFNKDRYLNLKEKIHASGSATGADGWLGDDTSPSRITMRPSDSDVRTKVVPALLEALGAEQHNNDIATGCMMALAKIGDAKTESGRSHLAEVIQAFLNSANQEISETAAVALGVMADPANVGLLGELLQDSGAGRELVNGSSTKEVPYRTRAFAAYGLAVTGQACGDPEVRCRIVRLLADVLESDRSATKDVKVAALIALGLIPVDELEPAGQVGQVGLDTAQPEPERSRREQIEYLLEFLRDSGRNHPLVRAHVPTAVARLWEDLPEPTRSELKRTIVPELLDRCADSAGEQAEVVQSCVLALGRFGDSDADKTRPENALDNSIRELLLAAPRELVDEQAKRFSMIAAGYQAAMVGSGPASDEGVKQTVRHLQQYLAGKPGCGGLRSWAALGLGLMANHMNEGARAAPSEIGVSLRSEFAAEKNPREVGALAVALGVLGDREALDPLLEKLDDIRDDQAKGYVCLGLGMIGDTEAIEPIETLVTESECRPDLLRQAAIALGLLGDKQVVELLTKMLEEEANSLATRAAIASALGFIGDKRSIAPLISMLQDQDLTPKARAFAAVALGIVCDKERFPWNSKIAVDLNYRASTATLNDEFGTGILNIL